MLDFTDTPVSDETTVKILSVCIHCGESRVVSVVDGSLLEWQKGHQCPQRLRPQSAAPESIKRGTELG